jgi:hypothetical protein
MGSKQSKSPPKLFGNIQSINMNYGVCILQTPTINEEINLIIDIFKTLQQKNPNMIKYNIVESEHSVGYNFSGPVYLLEQFVCQTE